MLNDKSSYVSPLLWKRPGLTEFGRYRYTTVLIELDNVLLERTEAVRQAVLATVTYVATVLFELATWQDDQPTISPHEVEFWQRVCRNTQDLVYVLTLLTLAKQRGTEERSSTLMMRQERCTRIDEAIGDVHLDKNLLLEIFREAYLGTQGYRQYCAREPLFFSSAPGCIQQERICISASFPARLRDAGVEHIILISRRSSPETASGLTRLAAHCEEQWWDTAIPVTEAQVDVSALATVLQERGIPGNALYISDSLNVIHPASYQRDKPKVLTILCGQRQQEVLRSCGADILLSDIEMLPQLLLGQCPRSSSPDMFRAQLSK